MANIPGTNSGHGHVWERPDGLKARCGGPALCAKCRGDQVTAMGPEILMNNKSPQELTFDEKLDTILQSVRDAGAVDDNFGAEDWSHSEQVMRNAKQSLKEIFISHMQAGFEYIVEPNGRVACDGFYDPGNIRYEVQRLVKERQTNRIAEWLLGSKEKQ